MEIPKDGLQVNVFFENKKFTELNPVFLGWEYCASGHAFGPHIRDFYLIHYVVSGRGEFESPRGHYTVSGGQIFLIRPGEVTYYRASDTDPWHYIWIGFSGRLASRFNELSDVCTLSDSLLFNNMIECERFGAMSTEYLTAQLYILMSVLFRDDNTCVSQHRNSMSKYAHQAADYIENNYMQSISVENISHDMGLSRRYLTILFKREYGVTTKDYITSVKMRHAREFLREGHSVGQTASMTGYSDYFNFTRMYKRYYGISPSADSAR